MSLPELRQELHMMTKEFAVSDHPSQLRNISEIHSNSIRILDCDFPMDCRCLSYAMGLAQNNEYVKIQRSSKCLFGIDVFAGEEFLKWLFSHQKLNTYSEPTRSKGDLVLYFDEGKWIHAGIVNKSNRVISKWGEGLLYEHDTSEVPENYGMEIQYYKAIEPDDAYLLFVEFAKGKGITFDE